MAAKRTTTKTPAKQADAVLAEQPQARTRPIWFKAKLYGWGWYPATWQGWLIIAIDTALFATIAVVGFEAAENWQDQIFFIWIPWIGLLSLTTAIAYHFGEKPHWQWGKPGKSKS